jgi:hypothetical protein
MSKFAIIGVWGMFTLSILSRGLIDFSIGYKNSMLAFISLLLFVYSLFVVLSTRYEPKDKNWAYGTIGALTGFWLHGSAD